MAFGEVYSQRLTSVDAPPSNSYVVRLKMANFVGTPDTATSAAIITARGSMANTYIGHAAAAGDAYDFLATPIAVTFGGSATMSQNEEVIADSDEIAFSWNGSSDILIAFESASVRVANRLGTATGVDSYTKAVTGETATVNKSGYATAASTAYAVESLRLNGFSVGATEYNYHLVCDGTSTTQGVGATSKLGTYPSQLPTLLRYGTRTVNLGAGGENIGTRAFADATNGLAQAGSIAILQGGSNDMGTLGLTAAATLVLYEDWCNQVRAEGYSHIVVMTVTPRSSPGTVVGFETQRQTFNTTLRSVYTDFADALADNAADPRIGDAGDEADTTYFAGDLLHLNDAGYDIISGIIAAAVLAIGVPAVVSGVMIDDLPVADALDGTELVPIVQSGTTKYTTVAAIATMLGG